MPRSRLSASASASVPSHAKLSSPPADPTLGTHAPQGRTQPKPIALLSTLTAALLGIGLMAHPRLAHAAQAPNAEVSKAAQAPINSTLDGSLFYQLLVAEIQLNSGDPGSAYQIYLEGARRLQNGQLYQRAVEVALRAKAGEQALSAAKAWRQALPQSREAAEFNTHILIALGRPAELVPPLKALIQLTATPQQPQLIASLPRSLSRLSDRQAAARVMEEATQPWRAAPLETAEAWSASAETWLMAQQEDKALAAAQRALALKPDLVSAQLVTADLVGRVPAAEADVRQRLSQADASPVLRLAYARKLATSQRFEEAAAQLDQLVAQQPDQAGHRVLLAAVRLEMRQVDAAEAALRPFLTANKQALESSGDNGQVGINKDLEQACLLMAQVHDRRNQPDEALKWLDRADPRRDKLAVQSQRARLLATQGRLSEARAALRNLPEAEPRDAVSKIQVEAQLLRELKQWREAWKVLEQATQRFPQDPDLLYDLAMVAEKLGKLDDMEALLRKVIQLAPDNAGAYNALGYSLADRNVRLPEARQLIEQALALRPGDPFITDSLGWVAFREGKLEEARSLLAQAYAARPDAEIAAHLGEVLWLQGQRDEALSRWREGLARDRQNETLQETIKRLGARP